MIIPLSLRKASKQPLWVGVVEPDDSIRATKGYVGLISHGTEGMVFGERFRYLPANQTVFWWHSPDQKIKELATSYLEGKGEHPLAHLLMSAPAAGSSGGSITHGIS